MGSFQGRVGVGADDADVDGGGGVRVVGAVAGLGAEETKLVASWDLGIQEKRLYKGDEILIREAFCSS